jgi:transforming growth factor-beta-induced protein
MRTQRTMRAITLAACLAMLAACAGDDTTATTDAVTDTTMTDTTEDTTDTTMTETTMTETTEGMGDMDLTAANIGPACASVPTEGEGSFDGMTDDPAATAASNNPALSTLVSAVEEAELVETLNGEGPFTIFAPANSAFEAIPAEDLEAVMADQETLTSILTYHVVAGEALDARALVDAGTVTTVQGGDLTIEEADGTVTVNGSAAVVCGNVATANAIVHIIDTVLMPSE